MPFDLGFPISKNGANNSNCGVGLLWELSAATQIDLGYYRGHRKHSSSFLTLKDLCFNFQSSEG